MNEPRFILNQLARITTGRLLHRLLIPVDGSERTRWGLNYARMRARRGDDLAVELLFVAESIQNWQVLRFWTRKEIVRFQAQRARFLLEDAEHYLRDAGVGVNTHFVEGDTAYHVLDMANKLGCDEIVLPLPDPGGSQEVLRKLSSEIRERPQPARLVTVDANGMPCVDRAVSL